jgi:hypothetical protein
MKETEIYSQEEIMQHFVVANIFLIQKLLSPYKLQRDALLASEKGLFHIDIEEQYVKILRSVLAVYLCQNLQITPLESLIFCEQLNVKDLL